MTTKLKIKLSIIAVLLFSCINLNAQNFDLGIAAGFDIVSLNSTHSSDDDYIYNLSPIASYNLNVFLSFKNKGFWGFSIEPGIIRKGWNQSYNSNDPKNKLRLYYLQIPVLSDFYLTDKLFFSIGPEINYLVSAKNQYESNTQDIVEYLNRFELSGMAAMNFTINEIYSVSFRYSHGITDINFPNESK